MNDDNVHAAEVVNPEKEKNEKKVFDLLELFVKEVAKQVGKGVRDALSGNSDSDGT